MEKTGLHIDEWPQLESPVLIAGFDGWGNALNISNGMLTYLIRQLRAEKFASLDPDTFYRYDEQRPVVNIDEVSTGEIWFGSKAKEKQLVDELQTSDDYIFDLAAEHDIFQSGEGARRFSR